MAVDGLIVGNNSEGEQGEPGVSVENGVEK